MIFAFPTIILCAVEFSRGYVTNDISGNLRAELEVGVQPSSIKPDINKICRAKVVPLFSLFFKTHFL